MSNTSSAKNYNYPTDLTTRFLKNFDGQKAKEEAQVLLNELRHATIDSIGLHPNASEGGLTIYYRERGDNVPQKVVVFGFTELGLWIEHHGELKDGSPKEFKVGQKVRVIDKCYASLLDTTKIYTIGKIEKNKEWESTPGFSKFERFCYLKDDNKKLIDISFIGEDLEIVE